MILGRKLFVLKENQGDHLRELVHLKNLLRKFSLKHCNEGDGVVPSSDCNFFGGVVEASMGENKQGSHVESWTP